MSSRSVSFTPRSSFLPVLIDYGGSVFLVSTSLTSNSICIRSSLSSFCLSKSLCASVRLFPSSRSRRSCSYCASARLLSPSRSRRSCSRLAASSSSLRFLSSAARLFSSSRSRRSCSRLASSSFCYLSSSIALKRSVVQLAPAPCPCLPVSRSLR